MTLQTLLVFCILQQCHSGFRVWNWVGSISHLQVTHLSLWVAVSTGGCGAGTQSVALKTPPAQGVGPGLCHWLFPSLGKRAFTPALEQLSRRHLGRGRLRQILSQLSGVNGAPYPFSSEGQSGRNHCRLRGEEHLLIGQMICIDSF